MDKLYLVTCQGYENIYVLAESFDAARQKWLDEYINWDEEEGIPTPIEDRISPEPDTIAYLANGNQVLLSRAEPTCNHTNTHNEDWPDGGIEVCDDCGMSRHHWEQGESSWIMVEDIPGAREELRKDLEDICDGAD